MSRPILIVAGETRCPTRPEDSYVITTKGGKQQANYEHRADAERFIKRYERKRK